MSPTDRMRHRPQSRAGWAANAAVVLLTTGVAVAVAVGLQVLRPPMWSASASLLVAAGAGPAGPGHAREASDLAVTYARLMPVDPAIVASVAGETGETESQVRSSTSVSVDPGTALMHVTFVADDRAVAAKGAVALAHAVTGGRPASPLIGAESVRVVSLPDIGDATRPQPLRSLVVAAVLGLALGVVAVLLWRRADPRVNDLSRLAAAVPCPVHEASGLSTQLVRALQARWSEMAGTASPVVLVLAVDGAADLLPAVVDRLATPGRALPGGPQGSYRPATARHPADDRSADVSATVAGTRTAGDVLGEEAEAAALQAELLVLLVPAGVPLRRLDQVLQQLHDIGVQPATALLARHRAPLPPAGLVQPSARKGPHPARSSGPAGGPETRLLGAQHTGLAPVLREEA